MRRPPPVPSRVRALGTLAKGPTTESVRDSYLGTVPSQVMAAKIGDRGRPDLFRGLRYHGHLDRDGVERDEGLRDPALPHGVLDEGVALEGHLQHGLVEGALAADPQLPVADPV